MRIRPIRPGKGHEEARGGISRRGAAAMQARRKGPRLLWSKHKTSLPAIPDEAAREIWRQPEEQNVKQSPLIHSFPNVSQNTLPASSAFRPFKSAHQGGIETDSGCAAGNLARSLIGLRRCGAARLCPRRRCFHGQSWRKPARPNPMSGRPIRDSGFQRTRNAASPIRSCGCFNILLMTYSLVCVF